MMLVKTLPTTVMLLFLLARKTDSQDLIEVRSISVNLLFSTLPHCFRMTQNVSYEFLTFSTIFCWPIETDMSGNPV